MKSCPRCKIKKSSKDWNKDGYSNTTYCRECQKYYNRQKSSRIKDTILRHTNNGKCWWVYQSILGDRAFRKD
jgi:hypothetical protein